MKNEILYAFILLVTCCNASNETKSCDDLLVGQYLCDKAEIDHKTQEAVNCTSNGISTVPCYPLNGIKCNNQLYNGTEIGFYQEITCRYTNGYSYTLAVGLSLFLGWLGVDRFYLGYPAIGLLKLCTFGFFGIGAFFDFLLITLQIVLPADGSNYTIDYFGPRIIHIFLNEETYFMPQPD